MGSTSCARMAYLPTISLVGVFFITMIFVSTLDKNTSIEFLSLFFAISSTKTNLLSLQKFKVIKRTMLTRLNCISDRVFVSLGKKTLPSIRSYAVPTGNNPEIPSSKCDPLGIKNNPVVGKQRHKEKHVQQCQEDPDCVKKECPTICGTPGKRHATAHFTHGKPTTSQGIVVSASQIQDYKGNPKAQNAVVYHQAHETAATPEIPDLTTFIKDKSVKNNINHYENIP